MLLKSDGTTYAPLEKRVHALQEEVLALQARYQRELQRLEQENRELRQQNMLLRQGRQPSTRKMKVGSLVPWLLDRCTLIKACDFIK